MTRLTKRRRKSWGMNWKKIIKILADSCSENEQKNSVTLIVKMTKLSNRIAVDFILQPQSQSAMLNK